MVLSPEQKFNGLIAGGNIGFIFSLIALDKQRFANRAGQVVDDPGSGIAFDIIDVRFV